MTFVMYITIFIVFLWLMQTIACNVLFALLHRYLFSAQIVIKPFVSLPCFIDVDIYNTCMAKCLMQSSRRISIRISRYNKNTCVVLFGWYVFASENEAQSILMKVTGLIRCSKEANLLVVKATRTKSMTQVTSTN